ncbi:Ubiquitin carboxyl-terminal hydrolase 12 [Vitis vinifera]|uniref:Ubiquitin carboxyl-terminal hydrolase 12 n=1 Tax=Vitis vinifera TaxID=29760 RepID=A0A438D7A1_VITVI|nr:Ubiquitin carboxyl-terminal hydrolase 12 [Vitis vinifera]
MEDGKLPGQCCSLHPLYIFYMYIDKFSDLTFTFQPAISRTLRYIQPSDYLFRVECVSSLMNTNIEKYESGKFEAGGYKWRLCLYPNGNIKSNGKGYISLYLAIADTKMLPLGWEVNVNFKLFVFNHKHDQYLTVQDAGGKLTRFNVMKTQCGFPQFLSLDVLNDPCNGYLMEDSCIFGAEVFVIKYSGKGECLSMIKEPVDGTFTWVIENFSTLKEKVMYSDVFTVEDFKWHVLCTSITSSLSYSKTKNKSLSLFLELADCETLDNQSKLYAEFELLISDQGNLGYVKHHAKNWFCHSKKEWGLHNMLSLCDFNNKSKGFVLIYNLTVQAKIALMMLSSNISN